MLKVRPGATRCTLIAEFMFRVQCTAIIFPARRCVPWKNSSRRRRGGFGPPLPPPIDRNGECCFLSLRLVVRKYYSSEKKKSPAPSSKDSKLLRAFNRVDFHQRQRVAKLSAISSFIISSKSENSEIFLIFLCSLCDRFERKVYW